MDKKKIIIYGVVALLVAAVVFLAAKLITGVFSLANGALNTVLAIIVIIAMIAIVIWMFAYAKSHKKK